MLMENKKLQHLNISGNDFGDDGVRNVTEGLQQNDTVTNLMLRGCNISVKGNYCNLEHGHMDQYLCVSYAKNDT